MGAVVAMGADGQGCVAARSRATERQHVRLEPPARRRHAPTVCLGSTTPTCRLHLCPQVDEATTAFEAGSGGMPFHEALARRLEVLQSQGALSVAQVGGAARWCAVAPGGWRGAAVAGDAEHGAGGWRCAAGIGAGWCLQDVPVQWDAQGFLVWRLTWMWPLPLPTLAVQPRGGKPLPAFALWAFAEEDYVQVSWGGEAQHPFVSVAQTVQMGGGGGGVFRCWGGRVAIER